MRRPEDPRWKNFSETMPEEFKHFKRLAENGNLKITLRPDKNYQGANKMPDYVIEALDGIQVNAGIAEMVSNIGIDGIQIDHEKEADYVYSVDRSKLLDLVRQKSIKAFNFLNNADRSTNLVFRWQDIEFPD